MFAIAVALAMLNPPSATAEPYIPLSIERNEMSVLYTSTIQTEAEYTRAWVGLFDADESEVRNRFKIIKILYGIDCGRKRFRILRTIGHDGAMKEIARSDDNEPWQLAGPRTMGATLLLYACDESKRSVQVYGHTDADILAKYREVRSRTWKPQ